MPTNKALHGGDLITDVRNLAIPFSLLIAQKGIEYLANRKTDTDKTDKKPAKKMTGGGHEGCALCAAVQAGGRSRQTASSNRLSHQRVAAEFKQISQELNEMLNMYKDHVQHHSS